MHPYLLGLRLQGRRVVVVGGGAVASRRIPALLDAGAEILLVSPKATASLEDLAAAGRIRWAAREYSARRLRRRLAGVRVHGLARGEPGRRRGGRSAADLVRARRRRRGVGRVDARLGPGG